MSVDEETELPGSKCSAHQSYVNSVRMTGEAVLAMGLSTG